MIFINNNRELTYFLIGIVILGTAYKENFISDEPPHDHTNVLYDSRLEQSSSILVSGWAIETRDLR